MLILFWRCFKEVKRPKRYLRTDHLIDAALDLEMFADESHVDYAAIKEKGTVGDLG